MATSNFFKLPSIRIKPHLPGMGKAVDYLKDEAKRLQAEAGKSLAHAVTLTGPGEKAKTQEIQRYAPIAVVVVVVVGVIAYFAGSKGS